MPSRAEFPHGRRMYTAISRKVVKKTNIKKHATRPKGGLGIHWNFAYWPVVNLQVCAFACGKFVFPLRGLYLYFSCRMPLSEENSSKLQRG